MQVVIIAGIQDKIVSRIINYLREVHRNTYFITLNRRTGSDRVSDRDLGDGIDKLIDYTSSNAVKSLGMIIDASLLNYGQIYADFFASAYVTTPACFALNTELVTTKQENECINRMKPAFRDVVNELSACSDLLYEHMVSKRNTTPLLLPINNYGKTLVSDLLQDVQTELFESKEKSQVLKNIIDQFNNRVNRKKIRSGPREITCYVSGNIVFKSPGKHTHGVKVNSAGDNHNTFCYLNGCFRIGAKIYDGFHYDCEDLNGHQLNKSFKNCCGEGENHRTKYINIYPSDFLRVPHK